MFILPIGDLLSSYTGDSRDFGFLGPIFDGYYEDIKFLADLDFQIQIMTLDDGVHVTWNHLKTTVEYEGKKQIINLGEFDRTWKIQRETGDPDDISEIDMRTQTIDLGPIIREEIIMACHNNF
ncbi:hypothetical protein K2X92_06120 [Candidatus Gracilibacteria bacterium]|nr:hypothetical protein [Candidatus Gracilibacteria bacterium]